MSNDLHILLALAIFGGGFYVASINSRASAAQLVADTFHQIPAAPAHGGLCLPTSFNIDDRRDPIAVILSNS